MGHYPLSPQLLSIITDQLLQNLDENFDLIRMVYLYLSKPEQLRIGKILYEHIHNRPEWPLETIINTLQLFLICLPHFTPEQIQQSFSMIVNNNIHYLFSSIVPYLNPAQLAQLHTLTQPLDIISRIDFYETVHEHHQLLNQAEYYQNLVQALHTYQQQHDSQWDVISVLNRITVHLHDHDARQLYQNSLQLLNEQDIENESYFVFSEAILQFKRIGLINTQTLQYFISYAARLPRDDNFEILTAILPPYLKTLEPEQAQQLASQINHSIEQITTCWP